jgi:hypothetical protein
MLPAHPKELAAPEASHRRFRKLRIVWSVGWGFAAVLLIALWVRSYWRVDAAYVAHSHSAVAMLGTLYIDAGISSPKAVPRHDYGPPTLRWTVWEYDPKIAVQEQRAAFPIWGLVLVLAACAPLSWLPSRFSLRTLLIATTLIAVGLGLSVWLR